MRRAITLVLALSSGCTCAPSRVHVDDDAGLRAECSADGDCESGRVCVDGACQAPDASVSLCDGDEDCPAGQVCVPSTRTCVTPQRIDAGEEDAGQTGVCFEGQTQSCGSSKLGECRLGLSTCELVGGVWQFGPCRGAVDPVGETCNGKDDDCDGAPDDGLGTLSCGVGACRRTVEACQGGQPGICTPGAPSAETCDGQDNDCNGTPDDLPPLSCGVGSCARSAPACQGGQPGICTPGQPAPEVCNGQDDDCDGTPDDGLGRTTCGMGVCQRTVDNCVGGMVQPCVPGTPSAVERCDGVDDDCDGQTDEGCSCIVGQMQPCYTGPPSTRNVGECRDGMQSCDGGVWGPCLGEVRPVAESCDNRDNDCNGTADDMGQTSCGVGGCRRTVDNCVGGVVQTCTPLAPVSETCNGVDDDCNGQVDDMGVTSCGLGECRVSVVTCVDGGLQTCVPADAGAEVCDGKDNDCDGDTDESFPQQDAGCSTGLPGPCGTGVWTCSGSLSCAQTVFATAEACNMRDDNCNGVVDDPPVCGCNPSIDNDLDGYNQCVDCNDGDGTIRPNAAEACNGKDDDCDGQVDEGFDSDGDCFTTCGTHPGCRSSACASTWGACAVGVDMRRADCNDGNAFVHPLKPYDCGACASAADAGCGPGNGVDDNCNGYVDETCGCTPRDQDNDGVTTCQGDCDDNDPLRAPGRTEQCDGKDNDCNTATVDNCGVSDPCGYRQGNNWLEWPAGTDRCKPDLVCMSDLQSGALTCHSFCNQTVGAGLNDSCTVGEGCNRTALVSDDLHLCGRTPTGSRTTGQSCTANADCRTGWCRTEGSSSYCSDGCTHESGCSGNTTCAIALQTFTQPPVTYRWFSSTCRLDSLLGTRGTGQSCTQHSECRANWCFNPGSGGRCIEPCCAHADCGMGHSCSIEGPRQSVTGGTQVSVQPACLASAATKVSGQVCASSAECRSGICERSSGICVDLCCNDTSCPNGTTCEPVMLQFSTGQQTRIRACLFTPVPATIEQR